MKEYVLFRIGFISWQMNILHIVKYNCNIEINLITFTRIGG